MLKNGPVKEQSPAISEPTVQLIRNKYNLFHINNLCYCICRNEVVFLYWFFIGYWILKRGCISMRPFSFYVHLRVSLFVKTEIQDAISTGNNRAVLLLRSEHCRSTFVPEVD